MARSGRATGSGARHGACAAYETLIDEQLIVSSGAAGTHVASMMPPRPDGETTPLSQPALDNSFEHHARVGQVFQMGVPAQGAFPAAVWSRILVRAARDAAKAVLHYLHPRGEPELRVQIAAYLAVARGMACSAAQIFVTGGHAASMSLAVGALGLHGTAWTEDRGYPTTRRVLAALGIASVPVPVDGEGLDVAAGEARAPKVELAVVTPGQQAPLGVVLSPARRVALLAWAARSNAWIVEDDYLSELQLQGRAAPALAGQDPTGHVLHVGSFSKTVSPALRLGFLVVPRALAQPFDQAAVLLGSAPTPRLQHAVAAFMQSGHQLRHLRRMKQVYVARRDAVAAQLEAAGMTYRETGLALLLRLPPGTADRALADLACEEGLAPVPLSLWYAQPTPAQTGLMLGVAIPRPAPEHASL